MHSIKDILSKKTVDNNRQGKPNSERAEIIDQLMKFMNEDPKNAKRFKYWLGRTRKLSPADIYMYMRQAKDGKNPQALFNWFLKKHYGKKT